MDDISPNAEGRTLLSPNQDIVQALCEAAISYGQDLQSMEMENKGSAYLCKLHKYKKI